MLTKKLYLIILFCFFIGHKLYAQQIFLPSGNGGGSVQISADSSDKSSPLAADPSGGGGGTGGGTIEICVEESSDSYNCFAIEKLEGSREKVAQDYVDSHFPGKQWSFAGE